MTARNTLQAWADANPDAAVADLDVLRVARAWEPGLWWVNNPPPGGRQVPAFERRDGLSPEARVGRVWELRPDQWAWWHQGKKNPRRDEDDAVSTAEEARALVDRGLAGLGFALARGPS